MKMQYGISSFEKFICTVIKQYFIQNTVHIQTIQIHDNVTFFNSIHSLKGIQKKVLQLI